MPVNECTTSYNGSQICVDCTGQPFVPTVPSHVVEEPDVGWTAGADLLAGPLSGDSHVVFSVGPSGGVVTGFASTPKPRPTPEDASDIHHGWYTTAVVGVLFAQPTESGVLRSTPTMITRSSRLEIRRVGSVVYYMIDDDVVYTSTTPSRGPLWVGAAMFASGDTIL